MTTDGSGNQSNPGVPRSSTAIDQNGPQNTGNEENNNREGGIT
jgi:hypothetical protein